MKGHFVQLSPTIYAGVFPRQDVGRGLEYIGRDLPAGNKTTLTVDCEDIAKKNGYGDLVRGIKVDYNSERLLIVEMV